MSHVTHIINQSDITNDKIVIPRKINVHFMYTKFCTYIYLGKCPFASSILLPKIMANKRFYVSSFFIYKYVVQILLLKSNIYTVYTHTNNTKHIT